MLISSSMIGFNLALGALVTGERRKIPEKLSPAGEVESHLGARQGCGAQCVRPESCLTAAGHIGTA